MNVSLLPSTQAFTSGAFLWVVAPPPTSFWARKIDWYLNFCLSKGSHHNGQGRPLALEKTLEQIRWQLPRDYLEAKDGPLLIAAIQRLPCDWVLLLDTFKNGSFDQVARTLSKVWLGLNQPRLRLFAPTQFDREQLIGPWKKSDLPTDFDFVVE